MSFSFDPGILVVVAALIGLYARAVRNLRLRGWTTPRRQQVAWYSGVALVMVSVMGPTGRFADDLMVSHMAEHLLLADIAAPLLLVGLRTPVLVHIPPRALLVAFARRRRPRRVLGFLTGAPVAIVIYLLVLFSWHLRPAFEGALRSPLLHGLQHQSFLAISLLVWWPALEPARGRMPGALWKIGHIFAARLISIFLGTAFIFGSRAFYQGYYGDRARSYGLTPLEDQQLAGGMMMTLDIIIISFALCLFFWRAAKDFDRQRNSASTRPAAVTASSE